MEHDIPSNNRVHLEPLDLKVLALIKEHGYTNETLLKLLCEFEIWKMIAVIKRIAVEENTTFKEIVSNETYL